MSIFEKGNKVTDNFTGEAFLNTLISDEDNIYDCTVYDVVFEPSTRNNWHSHSHGQILLCTDGAGFYQEKDKPARKLTKGDVVRIPPNVVHWHGAREDSSFTHIGITPHKTENICTWLSPVTDEEYNEADK